MERTAHRNKVELAEAQGPVTEPCVRRQPLPRTEEPHLQNGGLCAFGGGQFNGSVWSTHDDLGEPDGAVAPSWLFPRLRVRRYEV